jgi:hypothetical protein
VLAAPEIFPIGKAPKTPAPTVDIHAAFDLWYQRYSRCQALGLPDDCDVV